MHLEYELAYDQQKQLTEPNYIAPVSLIFCVPIRILYQAVRSCRAVLQNPRCTDTAGIKFLRIRSDRRISKRIAVYNVIPVTQIYHKVDYERNGINADHHQPDYCRRAIIVNGNAVTYAFDAPTWVKGFRLVVDSDLDREFTEGNPDGLNTSSVLFYAASYDNTTFGFPKCMVKHYVIEAQNESGTWEKVYEDFENHQRFIKKPLNIRTTAVRFIPLSTYFSETKTNDYSNSVAHIFNFEVY